MSQVNWYGEGAQKFVRKQTIAALRRACIEITRRAKELLSVSGIGFLVRGEVAKNAANRRMVVGAHLYHFKSQGKEFAAGSKMTATTDASGKITGTTYDLLIQRKTKDAGQKKPNVYGAFPSSPGEPPHLQTGQLRMSVTYEVDTESTPMQGRVGTNLDYGKFLEFGTKRGLKPRPWLLRAALEMRNRIDLHLSGGES